MSKETGIGENSIVRYEKAGLEEDGQYPTSTKLAALTFSLGLSHAEVLLSCLSKTDFDKYASDLIDNDSYGLPLYRSFIEESIVYAHENAKLLMMLRVFLLEREGELEVTDEAENWIRDEFYRLTRAVHKEDDEDIYHVEDYGDDEDLEKIITKNGSELKEPSRLKS